MIPELAERWTAALQGETGARDAALLRRRTGELGLVYGERPVCQVLRPLFVPRSAYEDLIRRGELLAGAIHGAMEAALRDDGLMAALGFDEVEKRIIGADRGFGAADLVGRLDALPAPGRSPVFIEYNGESPGGLGFGDMLGLVFEEMETWEHLEGSKRFDRISVVPSVIEAFLEGYRLWCRRLHKEPVEHPKVAIVDVADVPTRSEFEIFRNAFELRGSTTRIVSEDQVTIEGDRLLCGDFEPNIIYRRLVTMDILARSGGRHALIEAARRQLAFVGCGFEGYGLCSKGHFAVLSDPTLRPSSLSDEVVAMLETSIPWTRLVRDVFTNGPGERSREEPLETLVLREQKHLVLKASRGYGGRDVILGWKTSRKDWRTAWETALQGSWIVQERVDLPQAHFPVWTDHGIEDVTLHYDLAPYMIAGQCHGLGVRLSSNEILNVAAGRGSAVPALLVAD